MKLAVIGSGGREHAICYKLKQSIKLKTLICIPGNAGRVLNITSLGKDISIARKKSLGNIKKINWSDGFFRKDIGWKIIKDK